jgi:poly-gamma-glutamate synthesis protein (capsule biosynthesis protein)
LWISPAVPPALAQLALASDIPLSNNPKLATLRLDVSLDQAGILGADSTWIYALVAPFPALLVAVRMDDLVGAWSGDATSSLLNTPVWMDESTRAALTSIWGDPNPALMLSTAAKEDLLDSAWNKQPSIAIIPFEDIEPRWKVISIDGRSPIHKDFDPLSYPLKINFSLSGEAARQAVLSLPETNRDPEKMTTLVMTGVTALVRYTAVKMELNGRTYPGEAIRDWLVNADITHISNEVPFAPNCPYPQTYNYSLFFCSHPLNIELLEYIGTDVVELTGNHFQDWGSDATLFTLEMYDQRNWPYFGGGANLEDARKSITIEHNGNNLAFIGCNPAGPDFAWATETEPGASPCDWSWIKAEITRLRSEGYLPIMTFQYFEGYGYYPGPGQMADFRMMAEAGAVIVSGSQAHFPQTMEFHNESFIHYGLGNLFFDQMDFPVVGTRREFIDRHVFYNGEYINTELLTAMLEDYSRPRPMTEAERKLLLSDVFRASGW